MKIEKKLLVDKLNIDEQLSVLNFLKKANISYDSKKLHNFGLIEIMKISDFRKLDFLEHWIQTNNFGEVIFDNLKFVDGYKKILHKKKTLSIFHRENNSIEDPHNFQNSVFKFLMNLVFNQQLSYKKESYRDHLFYGFENSPNLLSNYKQLVNGIEDSSKYPQLKMYGYGEFETCGITYPQIKSKIIPFNSN